MIDYGKYSWEKKEFLSQVVRNFLVFCGILYLFYQSVWIVLLAVPISLFTIKRQKRKLIEERKWQLNMEFKEGILAISAALSAGYSIENAFAEAIKDLQLLYGKESYIIPEFEFILYQLQMNQTIESAIENFAQRSAVEDIYNFSEVVTTAKRTGGDFIKIIRSTGKIIADKIEIKREIKTLVTAKKFEVKIMNVIPLGIIVYLWVTSPGFLNPLYHNITGVIIMIAALAAYSISYFWAEKIMDIAV